jgi:hypothetical protein
VTRPTPGAHDLPPREEPPPYAHPKEHAAGGSAA